jgi:hypothetical protein
MPAIKTPTVVTVNAIHLYFTLTCSLTTVRKTTSDWQTQKVYGQITLKVTLATEAPTKEANAQAKVHSAFPPLNKGAIDCTEHNSPQITVLWL